MKKLLILLLLMVSTNVFSNSEVFYNGEKLINDIKSDDLSANAYASGFIIGVIGVNYDNREICIDEGVTGDQLIQITKNYLEKHPDSWKYTASSILIFAIKEFYPCKK